MRQYNKTYESIQHDLDSILIETSRTFHSIDIFHDILPSFIYSDGISTVNKLADNVNNIVSKNYADFIKSVSLSSTNLRNALDKVKVIKDDFFIETEGYKYDFSKPVIGNYMMKFIDDFKKEIFDFDSITNEKFEYIKNEDFPKKFNNYLSTLAGKSSTQDDFVDNCIEGIRGTDTTYIKVNSEYFKELESMTKVIDKYIAQMKTLKTYIIGTIVNFKGVTKVAQGYIEKIEKGTVQVDLKRFKRFVSMRNAQFIKLLNSTVKAFDVYCDMLRSYYSDNLEYIKAYIEEGGKINAQL